MAPVKYGDIQKSASDILQNDYCFDKKFKLSTKSANGVKITAEGAMKSKGTAGKLTAKFNVDNISIDKLSTTSSGRFIAEASATDLPVVSNLKVGIKIEDGVANSGTQKGSVNATYKADNLTLHSDVDVLEGPTLYGAGTFDYEGFTVGGEFKYNTQYDDKEASAQFEDYGVTVAYADVDYTASVRTLKKFSVLKAALSHKMDADTNIAAVFEVEPKGSAKTMTFGATKVLDAQTSFTGKVDSNAVISANYIQKLSSDVKLIASASFNAKSLASDSHKFGLQLVLG